MTYRRHSPPTAHAPRRLASLLRPLLPALVLALPAACSAPGREPAQDDGPGSANAQAARMRQEVDELTTAVRLRTAEQRIVELERRVGTLEANPEKIETDLLKQRLEQLEARVYAGAEPPAAPAPPPRAPRPASEPAPRPTPNASRFNPFGL